MAAWLGAIVIISTGACVAADSGGRVAVGASVTTGVAVGTGVDVGVGVGVSCGIGWNNSFE